MGLDGALGQAITEDKIADFGDPHRGVGDTDHHDAGLLGDVAGARAEVASVGPRIAVTFCPVSYLLAAAAPPFVES